MSQPIVSIVLAHHHQTLFLHRTLKSLERSIQYAQQRGIPCEVIGEIAKAKGKYIVLLNDDGLISENWIYTALNFYENQNDRLILHPEYYLVFGSEHLLCRHPNSEELSLEHLLENIPWSKLCFFEKDIYLKMSHSTTFTSLEAFADAAWIYETLAKGFKHVRVPLTAHFIRHGASGPFVMRRALLFNQSQFLSRQAHPKRHSLYASAKKVIFKSISCAMQTLRNESILYWQTIPEKKRATLRKFLKYIQTLLQKQQAEQKIPNWLREEMKRLSTIEATLFPSIALLSKTKISEPLASSLAYFYQSAFRKIDGFNPTHVLLAPALRIGGADLLTLRHLDAITSVRENRVILITTETLKSTHLPQHSSSIQTLEFGQIASSLSYQERARLLARFLIQLAPKTIHNIQSPLGYQAFIEHGEALKVHSRLFASVFSDDYDLEGQPIGYTRDYLFDAFPHLSKVLSDNSVFPKKLIEEFGYAPDQFQTVYAPMSITHEMFHRNNRRVLWASRLDRPKRYDILIELAKRHPHLHFDIYGTALFDTNAKNTLNRLKKMENVSIKGPYTSFIEIAQAGYAAYLYASDWDGLANTLLESASVGLPIVSSMTGGAPDLLSAETAFIVAEINSIHEFSKQLSLATEDINLVQQKTKRMLELIVHRHSFKNFVNTLSTIEGYL